MTTTRIIESRPLLMQRFEVVGVLGEGAAGAVYKVKDRARDNTIVALKVLVNESAFDEHTKTRFKNEWQVSHTFRHKNLVEAYELIELDGAIAYTMEFVSGKDLARVIRERELSFAEIDSLLVQIAAAVEYLHKKNVLHRDIKLENILLTDDGIVKVSDFGLIKSLGEKGLTKTGILLGTAQYMPPEYIKKGNYEQRSDIYAIGVVLYELLTGERWLANKSGNEVIDYLIKSKFVFPPITTRPMPEKYHNLLHACLHPQIEKRFATMADLQEAIPSGRKRQKNQAAEIGKNQSILLKRILPIAAGGILLASAGVVSVTHLFGKIGSASVKEGTYQGVFRMSTVKEPIEAVVQVGAVGVMVASGNFCEGGFMAFEENTLRCGNNSYPVQLTQSDKALELTVFHEGAVVATFHGE